MKKGALEQFVEDFAPDILCLSEIRCKENHLSTFEHDYKFVYWNAAETRKGGYSGTAILSNVEPISCQYGLRKPPVDGFSCHM